MSGPPEEAPGPGLAWRHLKHCPLSSFPAPPGFWTICSLPSPLPTAPACLPTPGAGAHSITFSICTQICLSLYNTIHSCGLNLASHSMADGILRIPRKNQIQAWGGPPFRKRHHIFHHFQGIRGLLRRPQHNNMSDDINDNGKNKPTLMPQRQYNNSDESDNN